MSKINLLQSGRSMWQRIRDRFPFEGFHFDRPIVIFQSDDWGRAGLRDQQGLHALRAAGLKIGERPYDLYTLETAEDLAALQALLHRHRDSTARPASVEMNFIVENLDLDKMKVRDFRELYLCALADGLPHGWNRPGLLEAYREGIHAGIFHPALHGITHFCRKAVERQVSVDGERAALLHTLWNAGTPYIYWRMPWIGYEYWEPEKSEESFLDLEAQQRLVGQAVGAFTRLFSFLPQSACAPGYRADDNTHRAWAQFGVSVAQNGPGTYTPPHFDPHGILNLYRTVEFEPALNSTLSIEECVNRANKCFERGIPAIVSIHSINFHSSLSSFRNRTIPLLEQFLTVLETRYDNLLYLHGKDLYDLIDTGRYGSSQELITVNVTKKKFTKRQVRAQTD